jgi:hypothetical protein
MIGEDELKLEVEKLKEIIPQREWRYYYLNSVENFIYHLKSFKDERTRARMVGEIKNYLEKIYEKVNQNIYPQDKAKQLMPELWRISNTYKDELGFTSRPTYFGMLILLIPLFFILKSNYNFSIGLVICVFVFCTYVVYSYIKVKSRKIY